MPIDIILTVLYDGTDSIPGWEYLKTYVPVALTFGAIKYYFSGASNTWERDLHGKVYILTGATTGMGAQVAYELATRGAQLVLLVRSTEDIWVVDYVEDLRNKTNNVLIYAEAVSYTHLDVYKRQGYDISDYEKVYPKYGTNEDMQALIDETHKRGMKLVLDLVINHTSSEHAWFKESRSSKTNPKRDWYIWKPPKFDADGKRHPPNNWSSYFSGSAWEYDELTEEYYLRLFARTQPDLNWENDETRKAVYDSAMKFWLDKGIDGFRIDTAGLYSKDQRFPDCPIVYPDEEFQPSQKYSLNGPRIHEFHKEMYANVTSNYDAMTVGEVGHCSREDALKYVSAKEQEMNMIFLFNAINVGYDKADRYRYKGWTLTDFKKAIQKDSSFIEGTDAWSTVFIENHDIARSVTRFGSPKHTSKSAKLISLLESTLTGTL